MTGTRGIILEETEKTLARIEALGYGDLGPAAPIAARFGPAFEDRDLLHEPPSLDYQIDNGVERKLFQRFDWAGLTNPQGAPPLVGAFVRDSVVQSARKWCSRPYEVGDLTYERVAFLGTELEHDIYVTIDGGDDTRLVCRNGFSRNAGGQTIQTTQREWEGADLTPGGTILVEDWFATNPGSNYNPDTTRRAFAFSFFAAQRWDKVPQRGSHDVTMRRACIDKSMQTMSTGCLLVQSRARAHISNAIFLAGTLEQPMAKFEGEGDIAVIERWMSHAAGGQNWVHIDPGWEKVWISGCVGNTHVHYKGKDLLLSEVQGWL